jgi:hypothetical protein
MTTVFQRYAIYWTPWPGSDFARFGERWFGPAAEVFGLAPELAARAKAAPARYGLHATLKAPFRLRPDVTVEDVQRALDDFCAVRRAPWGGPLRLAQFQDYLGLVLSAQTAAIDWLAAECVTRFDRFRAPLDKGDRDRRADAGLTAEERTMLETFGYPYVLSTFRFHISLAGALSRAELNEVSAALAPHLVPFMSESFRIGDLSLLGEPLGGGVFALISRHRFR